MKNRQARVLSMILATALVMPSVQVAFAEETTPADGGAVSSTIVINEIEADGTPDWVEIYNYGDSAVDLSGWYILDDEPDKSKEKTTPLADNTMLEPGQFLVLEGDSNFTFGLSKKGDTVSLFNKDDVLIDEYSWTSAAGGTYARIPDGTGDFTVATVSTKGATNKPDSSGTTDPGDGDSGAAIPGGKSPVIINEVQSSEPNGGADWIELANPTDEVIDISGIVIKDEGNKNPYTIPAGTTIPAHGYIVFYEKTDFQFGLGKGDSVRLFQNDELIDATTWPKDTHTKPTWGRYPDMFGTEFKSTWMQTPGTENQFPQVAAGVKESAVDWPGSSEVTVSELEFLTDSSGLDFFNGQLYAVDNGTGKFWILDVTTGGAISFANGFENGKRVRFKGETDVNADGPDTEGITVDGDGFVYLASERDNSETGKIINCNKILKADPRMEGDSIEALMEWDLTESLNQAQVADANYGIEAVQWVAAEEVNGKLYDQNTGAPFDIGNYPDASANGVFFVAYEINGHAYAYVLNNDGTYVQIADIDSRLGKAMALDYDTYEHVLWIAVDNDCGNMATKVTFTGKEEVERVYVNPAAGLDSTKNYEGFAIAEAEYTVNGIRPVYHFEDGVDSGMLVIGGLACDYKPVDDEDKNDDADSGENNDSGSDNNSGTGNDSGAGAGSGSGAGSSSGAGTGSGSGTGTGNGSGAGTGSSSGSGTSDNNSGSTTTPDAGSDSSQTPGNEDNTGANPTPDVPSAEVKIPEKGTTLKDTSRKTEYVVTKAGTNKKGTVVGGEVAYAGTSSKTASLKIPGSVTIEGVSYKVTSIKANAFKNNKKLKTVTVGTNIKSIEKNAFYKCPSLTKVTISANVKTLDSKAFYGCKNLKTIVIKSTKLTSTTVGSKVFAGIAKNATIKVPKTKLTAYKKLLKKAGVSSGVKIKTL